jgi:DNA-binding CsgD family transcriptional regulator
LIYQSVLEPDQWRHALASIVASFRGDHAFLYTNKKTALTNPFLATTGIDDDDLARYFSPDGMRLWAPWQEKCTSGKVTAQHELISDHDFERSEAYNEMIRPTGGFHAGFFQQDTPDLSFHVAICRPRGPGHFTSIEKTLLQSLAPHFTAAMELRHRLNLAEQHNHALASALDRITEGAIVADAKGAPLVVNARAQTLLDEGDGLVLGALGLRPSNGALTELLLNTIATTSANARCRRLHVPRRPPRLPLLLDILPVRRLAPSAAGTAAPAVVIFINEPDAPLSIDIAALSAIYALTPREAETAALLARGTNIKAIAAKLGLADGTVRFNLKRAFEKTGARSQAALVALVRGFGSAGRG